MEFILGFLSRLSLDDVVCRCTKKIPRLLLGLFKNDEIYVR